MSYHVTYIRNSDRTRIVYVLDTEPEVALHQAADLAPPDFHLAAHRPHNTERMHVPRDGDGYGATNPQQPDLMFNVEHP